MRIWFALLLAPVLALADQSVSYAMAGWACAHQHSVAAQGVHFVFLAAVVAATIMAWQLWHATPARGADEPAVGRHFLAGLATASGALSGLVIIAMWIPNWMLSPCFA
jgi:hypothetical protein